ncbi:MAG TPA: hypothetical protein VFQ42_10430, partial [Mycobacterium sp.]|nr:hypothetical protein [Mycobacterium sp.]
MTMHEASRTLLKSPPELWAECSDAASLNRHLDSFGEIRITRLEPETAVAWEGETVSGTVRLEPSGWGTRVILTAEEPTPAGNAPPPGVHEPAPAAGVAEEKTESEGMVEPEAPAAPADVSEPEGLAAPAHAHVSEPEGLPAPAHVAELEPESGIVPSAEAEPAPRGLLARIKSWMRGPESAAARPSAPEPVREPEVEP